MPVFLVRNNLSRGDLQLFLSNSNGYAQDAASVKWTVYANDGTQASGRSLPAIRQTTGRYYAPWFTNVPNGNYKVVWEVMQEFGGPVVRHTEFIFVVDPSDYVCPWPTNNKSLPVKGELTFLTGQALGPGDLALYLRNADGLLQNAFCVFFKILDVANNAMVCRTPAMNYGMGTYYAPWFVGVCSGDYIIEWEWQTDQNAPMTSSRCGFGVVDPANPYSVVVPILCSSSLFSTGCGYTTRPLMTRVLVSQCDTFVGSCSSYRQIPCQTFSPPPFVPPAPCPPSPPNPGCCDVEIARTIHLPYFVLPGTGQLTNQPKYVIPDHIHKIAFYIQYAYGAPGGYVTLRLLWGNGTEETQQTLIDQDITIQQPNSFQNMLLQDLDGPIPQSGLPISFMVEAVVPGGSTTVRLLASEGGMPGTPGSCGITLTASSE
jgi:hypothetical protein